MPQLHSQSMNLYSLFTKVRKKLSESTAAFWSDLEVYNSLNRGQLHIQRKSKVLKKTVTITTTTGTRDYDLKSTSNNFTDIMDISEDGVEFKINGSNRHPLNYKPVWKLNQESPGWRDVSNSVPQDYYFNKASKVLSIHPGPNATNAGAYLFVTGTYKPKILNAGTAAGGSTTTITLATGSSTVPYPSTTDDYYNGLFIEIYSGEGAGQMAEITDYVGSTRICTAAFTTKPDTTSIYGMIPELPDTAHDLMYLYALGDLWDKGGSRSVLGDRFRRQYFEELAMFVSETIEEDDESLESETYR